MNKTLIICLLMVIIVFSNVPNYNSKAGSNSVHLLVNNNQIFNHHIGSNILFKNSTFTLFTNQSIPNQTIQPPDSSKTVTSSTNSSEIGFISTWNIKISRKVRLPLVSDGDYDFNVLWGDGTNSTIKRYNQPDIEHFYGFSNDTSVFYTLNITGTIIGWSFNIPYYKNNPINLVQISNWGSLRLGNNGYYFSQAKDLVITTKDALDLNGTTNLQGIFYYCRSLGSSGNLNSWNVSQVTDMSYMFSFAIKFNQSLNSWDVSKVTNMNSMFIGTQNFNQPLDSWNVSQVTDMSHMFALTLNFNQSLSSWDVSQVKEMISMFQSASSFNQPLDSWNVSQVDDMSEMFWFASKFNQPLGTWDVSQVHDMSEMFWVASNFDQPLGSWNISQVSNMMGMFIDVSLSTFNYDQLLRGWASLPTLSQGVTFNAGNSTYSSSAQNARNKLIKIYNWTIIDKGLISPKPTSLISVIITVFTTAVIVIVIGLLTYLILVYIQYQRNKKKTDSKNIKFLDHIKRSFTFSKSKSNQKEKLRTETLNKIKTIIDENKEK